MWENKLVGRLIEEESRSEQVDLDIKSYVQLQHVTFYYHTDHVSIFIDSQTLDKVIHETLLGAI